MTNKLQIIVGEVVVPIRFDASFELKKEISAFCNQIAGKSKITAVCMSEDYTIEAPTSKSTIEVLLVLRDFQPRLISHVRVICGRNVIVFSVDQWVFERDVDRGFLGEALARLLIFPYIALNYDTYLQDQEILLKKRLILELLENLTLSYPELSYHLRVKPEYFMYEVVLNRVRVFPPMAYGASHFFATEANRKKNESVLGGYTEALKQLDNEGVINFTDGHVTMSANFITASQKSKIRFTNIIKNAPRALFTSLFGVFPQLLTFLSENSEALFHFQTPPWRADNENGKTLIDPQRYVLVPTAEGFVSLANKIDIRAYTDQVLKEGEYKSIKVEEFGGFLNDVFLIKAYTDHIEKKVLVKRFKDLYSMKWFPLSMWSIGARSFAVLGRSRLEREVATNELLAKSGFCVPKILHVNARQRLVFMEFIGGENFSVVIKRIAKAENIDEITNELSLIAKVGETYARVHALKVVLGDTKPENIMLGEFGNLCLLDFEQSSRNGDKSWDVACFLYYCGHYLPINSEHKAVVIAQEFIKGYLAGGGNIEVIKCAAVTKYTRVFSIFTLPTVLRIMSSTCKNAESSKRKK